MTGAQFLLSWEYGDARVKRISKLLSWQWAPDDLLVRAPRKYKRIVWLLALPMPIGLAAVAAAGTPGEHWYKILAGPVLGLLIARACMNSMAKFVAYRNGWIEGRAAMVGALVEAGKRQLTVGEWLQSQAEADAALMGVPAPKLRYSEDD